MEASVHRFVRLLRLAGVRISVSEAVDAMRCATQPGVLDDRGTLRSALRVSLVKDRRDEEVFDEIFDAYFSLVRIGGEEEYGHGHGHDDLSDTGDLESYTVSELPSEIPQQGHDHGSPDDIRDYFDPEDLAQQYNLHQEANKLDMSAMTDEIVFSKDQEEVQDVDKFRVQIETERLGNAGLPGHLTPATGNTIDAKLTIAEQDTLLGWLDQAEEEDDDVDVAALRRRLAGVLEGLPEALKRHLAALLALEQTVVERAEGHVARLDRVDESERAELEESLRRLAKSLHGALTHRRRIAARGRIDPGRTMRTNMRFDAVPFLPVTVRRSEDKPRLVVLADVSLSVRATARFTLHLVHGLQNLFAQVRSFAFVDDIAEITELFADHPAENALGLVFGGDVLDVDANSNYGLVLGRFVEEHLSAVTHRTTVLVLGDGRGNGNDPNLSAFEEIARRARETIWLTPEPRHSWALGRCDLPLYADYCDRVRVVRDLSGLRRTSVEMADGTASR